jgi:hypothetical protein
MAHAPHGTLLHLSYIRSDSIVQSQSCFNATMGTYIGTCVENFRLISTLRDKSYFSMTAIQLNAVATFSASYVARRRISAMVYYDASVLKYRKVS